jgi:hypothetical protein
MPWIKRNVPFVVGLAVAILLLGGGVFYLLGKVSAANAAREELASENAKLSELVDRKPAAPNDENIKAAVAQQEQIRDFKATVRPIFKVTALPENLDDASFKNLLDRTVDSLEKLADRNGVKLPKPADGKFAFTFEGQKKQLEFSAKALPLLTVQLLDIQDICHVLFNAKIHNLEAIRRVSVGTNDVNPPANYLTKKQSTNAITKAAVQPYEVIFHCFSAELASVLSGLVNADPVFIVKSINVERGSTDGSANAAAANPMGMNPSLAARYGMPPGMASRYGMGPAVLPSGPKPGEAPLDDKPLRVTLNIDVVKLPPEVAQPGPAKAAKPAKKG